MRTILLLLMLLCSSASAQKGKTILAVFAHEDDEKIIAPVLAKYAAAGADVYIAVVTDGRFGVRAEAHIPSGDSLAHIRAREMICAAQELGIHPPILMDFQDGLNAKDGKVQATLDRVRERIAGLFNQLRPDVVITWGASGWTGHPDHRLIGNVVTDVFSVKQWGKPAALYYPEIPTGYFPKQSNSYATVDQRYLTVQIPLSTADLEKAKAALHCHKSQYEWGYAENTHKRIWKDAHPVAFLRPFISDGKVHHSFFTELSK